MSKSSKNANKDVGQYIFEQLSPDALTVSINIVLPEVYRQVIDLRSKSRLNSFITNRNQLFRAQIIQLNELGFDYIDFGTHSDWIAAEIPFSASPSEEKLHAAGKILMSIKYLQDSRNLV
jgi:hypothetical protein